MPCKEREVIFVRAKPSKAVKAEIRHAKAGLSSREIVTLRAENGKGWKY
ncbi:Hypothetical protein RG540_CH03710 [Neorhizobium galegae bv. orientalis str. HAMBI 540]|uniref:Uncharacterized protein n=1 Tax=Neorhizobium galegae bv. orientalis str. HAMBI 540 TaxID=1028800 RepID=A0A068SKE9_NEOGA|nr:Hypothetical protein RG540_CH03710 [Neorhizobium galegae bv. orientalis str. HAMBI 540]